MMRDLASGIQLLGLPRIGGKLWEEVKRAKCVVELNWKKFDRRGQQRTSTLSAK